jgi:hypothetical protein
MEASHSKPLKKVACCGYAVLCPTAASEQRRTWVVAIDVSHPNVRRNFSKARDHERGG